MKEIINQYNRILDNNQKQKLIVLFVIMTIGAIFETLSISLLIPFIALISEPELIYQYELFKAAIAFFHIESTNQILILITLILMFVFIFKNLFLYFMQRMQSDFVVKNCYLTSLKLFKSLLNEEYEFFLYKNSNSLSTLVNVYVTKAFVLIGSFLNLMTELVINVILITFLLSIQWKLTVILTVVFLLFLIFTKKYLSPKLKMYGAKSNLHYEIMVQTVTETISGIKEIKLLNKEPYFIEKFEMNGRANVELENKRYKLQYMPKYILEVIAISSLLLFILVNLLENQDLTSMFAELSILVLFLIRLMPGVMKINSYWNEVIYYSSTLLKIDEEMKRSLIHIESQKEERSKTIITFTKEISFNEITYTYPHRHSPVIENANFVIPFGKAIGFIGGSGEGKTTAIDILLGYLKPQSGQVLVDGIDIHENVRSWMKQIGYIPQMIFLLDSSIRDNISFGSENHSDDQIWKAIKEAQLFDFVSSLPKGLDTVVGERGIRLSGGQRQRIGIARALYYNPKVLVFDEATAALDSETESKIMDVINNLIHNKTIIMIAHRHSTLQKCDLIYEVTNGKIRKYVP